MQQKENLSSVASNGMKLFERVPTDSAIIAILIVVTLCVRLISFSYLSSLAGANPQAHPYPVVAGDSSYYARWADNLLTLRAYEDPPGKPLHAAPPGYPALLAGIKAVTGSVVPVVVLQIFLSAFVVMLIYTMARTLVPLPYAPVPALVYGIDPMVAFADSAVMTDGLFSALLVCIAYLAFFQSRVKGVLLWGLVGILLGVATMFRPIGQFLVLLFPAMLILRAWFEGGIRPVHLKAVCACVLAFAVVVTPWMLRNERIFGVFEISPLGGHNLLTNNVKGFLAWRELSGTPEALPAILVMRHFNDPVFLTITEKLNAALAEITPAGKNSDNYEGKLAVRYIMNDPLRYSYFHAVNTLPFFLSSSLASYGQIVSQLQSNEGFYAPVTLSILDSLRKIRHPENASSFIGAVKKLAPIALEMFWWFAATILALAVAVLRRKDFTTVLFAVLVLYFAALTGPMSNSRYRIPAEPYLLILAVTGAHALISRRKGNPVRSSPPQRPFGRASAGATSNGMTTEICIPAFNEEQIIAESARAVLKVFRSAGREVIVTVADNDSTDRTADIAKGIEGVSVISISTRGKGAAIVAAARHSGADLFGFIDADLSANPEDIISLISFVERGDCDIAIGSRLMDSTMVERGMLRTLSSKIFSVARKRIVGVSKIEDTQCGLKLMNARGREILAECAETGWFFDMEFLARAEKAGLRIREVPIRWDEYRFPDRVSKLNYVRDGIEYIRAMFRIRRAMATK